MQHDLILPNRKELTWGRRYLLFQLVFLGYFLSLAAELLHIRLTAMTLNIAYFGTNFIVVALLCRKFLSKSLLHGLQHGAKCILIAVAGFFAYQLLMGLLGMLIIQIDPDFANLNDQNIASISRENFSLMVIGTVLLVPMTEETLYRGIIFGGLYRRSKVAAYLVSAVFFSLVHITGYFGAAQPLTLLLCFLQYIPAGICLAAAFQLSGSLLTPILIHTAINAIGMMAMR